jgi:hypothetical protein
MSENPPPPGADITADFRHYAALVRQAVVPHGAPAASRSEAAWQSESASAIQLERGTVYASAMIDPSLADDPAHVVRLVELARAPDLLPRIAVVDRTGHHRPVYRALLIYSWLQAYRIAFETLSREQFGQWEEGLRTWCELLEGELGEVEWPVGGMPAARGAGATESAWTALALHVAGKLFIRDAWTDLAADAFGRITRSQQDSGQFLHATASDNPETHWYHELVLLHAAAAYAVQAEDRGIAEAVRRNTAFHQAETQPDHATNQPWALFAFVWNPDTRPLADQLLHSVTVQQAAEPGGLSLILLADALYCLNLFLDA